MLQLPPLGKHTWLGSTPLLASRTPLGQLQALGAASRSPLLELPSSGIPEFPSFPAFPGFPSERQVSDNLSTPTNASPPTPTVPDLDALPLQEIASAGLLPSFPSIAPPQRSLVNPSILETARRFLPSSLNPPSVPLQRNTPSSPSPESSNAPPAVDEESLEDSATLPANLGVSPLQLSPNSTEELAPSTSPSGEAGEPSVPPVQASPESKAIAPSSTDGSSVAPRTSPPPTSLQPFPSTSPDTPSVQRHTPSIQESAIDSTADSSETETKAGNPEPLSNSDTQPTPIAPKLDSSPPTSPLTQPDAPVQHQLDLPEKASPESETVRRQPLSPETSDNSQVTSGLSEDSQAVSAENAPIQPQSDTASQLNRPQTRPVENPALQPATDPVVNPESSPQSPHPRQHFSDSPSIEDTRPTFEESHAENRFDNVPLQASPLEPTETVVAPASETSAEVLPSEGLEAADADRSTITLTPEPSGESSEVMSRPTIQPSTDSVAKETSQTPPFPSPHPTTPTTPEVRRQTETSILPTPPSPSPEVSASAEETAVQTSPSQDSSNVEQGESRIIPHPPASDPPRETIHRSPDSPERRISRLPEPAADRDRPANLNIQQTKVDAALEPSAPQASVELPEPGLESSPEAAEVSSVDPIAQPQPLRRSNNPSIQLQTEAEELLGDSQDSQWSSPEQLPQTPSDETRDRSGAQPLVPSSKFNLTPAIATHLGQNIPQVQPMEVANVPERWSNLEELIEPTTAVTALETPESWDNLTQLVAGSDNDSKAAAKSGSLSSESKLETRPDTPTQSATASSLSSPLSSSSAEVGASESLEGSQLGEIAQQVYMQLRRKLVLEQEREGRIIPSSSPWADINHHPLIVGRKRKANPEDNLESKLLNLQFSRAFNRLTTEVDHLIRLRVERLKERIFP